MDAPAPVNTGTALFIAAAAMAIIWAWAASKGGYISRDALKYVEVLALSRSYFAPLTLSLPYSSRIITVVIITLIIETWLLW